jgi:hypothetical protein
VPPVATGATAIAAHQPEPERAERVTISPQQVFAKWVQASGGADALNKVTTRVESGTITIGEMKWSIQVLTKTPRQRMSITHAPDGVSITAFDGQKGWLGTVGRGAHEMSPEEDYAAMLDAAVAYPSHAQKLFARWRMWKPELINGHDTNVVLGSNRDQGDVKMYFDKETGLLLRIYRPVETPIGEIPAQVDYDDYRTEGGIRLPYRWSIARPQGKFTIQIERVQQNVPLEDARFHQPQGTVPGSIAEVPK